jgi:hypothetical protein
MRLTRKFIVIVAAAVLVIAGVVVAVLYIAKPKPVLQKITWLVDRDYARTWSDIINESGLPYENSVIAFLPGSTVPENSAGFILATNRRAALGAIAGESAEKTAAGENDIPITIYQNLSESQNFEGAIPVIVNPWIVFYEYNHSALDRDRIDNITGDGALLLAGRDQNAQTAWLAQLLQTESGVFPEEKSEWERAGERLFSSKRFQGGAVSYNWNEVWALFQKEKPAWLYAPLSRIRALPGTETAGLVAERFPAKREWRTYGIQAEILWALPFNADQSSSSFVSAEALVKDPAIQTKLADRLFWVTASGRGSPYNAVSQTALFAWLNSSFVWEITPP